MHMVSACLLGKQPIAASAPSCTCPTERASAERNGARSGSSSLHLGAMMLTEVCLCWWLGGGGGMVSACSLTWGVEFAPAFFQEALIEENNLTPCVFQASLRYQPSPYLCLSLLTTQQYSVSVLSRAYWLGFKIPKYRDSAWKRPTPILKGKVSPYCGCCWFVPEG